MKEKERELTQEEALHIMRKLQMKYGAEIDEVQRMIEQDIQLTGHVTLTTQAAQKDLTNKILNEKEHYEQFQDS